ncbi:type I 3-dehydroquinate dehydratase [Absiella sp. AM29-15]|nr:type I 3-dehydroquinate dehydratase [Absiella sp. AM29-15]
MKNLSKRIDELTNFDYNVLVKGACCMLKIKNLTIGDGIPKICVPMCSANEEQLIKEADEIAAKHVDIAEWRMDHYENVFDIKRVVSFAETLKKHLADTLLLCTFRTGREGGNPIAFDDNLYFDMNKALIKSRHLDMIDLELFMDKLRLKELIATAHIYGIHVIMSNHDFHRTPGKEELMTRLMTMKRMEADILKIAVMPKNEEDLLTLLEVTQQMKSRVPKQALVTISMGKQGLLSRISGEIFGSSITFATMHGQSAPGQIPYEELQKVLQMIHQNLMSDEI